MCPEKPEWFTVLCENYRLSVKLPDNFLESVSNDIDFNDVKSKLLTMVLEFSLKQFDNEGFPSCAACIVDVLNLCRDKNTDCDKFEDAGQRAIDVYIDDIAIVDHRPFSTEEARLDAVSRAVKVSMYAALASTELLICVDPSNLPELEVNEFYFESSSSSVMLAIEHAAESARYSYFAKYDDSSAASIIEMRAYRYLAESLMNIINEI